MQAMNSIQEEEKYPETPPAPPALSVTDVAPPKNAPQMVTINLETADRTTRNHKMHSEQGRPKADPYQAMMMQKLMAEERKRMNAGLQRGLPLWNLFTSLILLSAAFGVLAFVWFADKPIASGDANPTKFQNTWPGVLQFDDKTSRALKTKWYFTNLKYKKDGCIFGHVLGGEGATEPETKKVDYDKFKGDNKKMVNYLGLMMKWGSIIPLCLLGFAVVLFALRFVLKKMQQKLTSAAMIFVGLATMGPIMIVLDVLITFNQMPIFEKSDDEYVGSGDEPDYDFKYGMTFWANIVAFCIIIALELFNVCC